MDEKGEDARRALGARGEDAVARELERRGWYVEARNWRFAGGELDIVASRELDGRELVAIVEVKTRAHRARLRPERSVTLKKRRQIARLAAAYLAARPGEPPSARFDVAALQVSPCGTRASMRYIPGAFDALGRWM